MSRPLLLSTQAEKDMVRAMGWYESRQRDLGRTFMADVQAAFELIERFPKGAQRIRGPIRQYPLRRFPFTILFAVLPDVVIVHRIFHTKQHPRKKLRR